MIHWPIWARVRVYLQARRRRRNGWKTLEDLEAWYIGNYHPEELPLSSSTKGVTIQEANGCRSVTRSYNMDCKIVPGPVYSEITTERLSLQGLIQQGLDLQMSQLQARLLQEIKSINYPVPIEGTEKCSIVDETRRGIMVQLFYLSGDNRREIFYTKRLKKEDLWRA